MTYDTNSLILRARTGDDAAKEELVQQNMRLVYAIASRFTGRGVDKEDLYQIGAIGLLSAIEKFHPETGNCFSTYAVPVISGEIKRYFRDNGAVKVSRTLKSLAGRAAHVTERLTAEYGRPPTTSELAEKLGISPEELAQATCACLPVRSFDLPVGAAEQTLAETLPAPEESNALLERLDISSAVSDLPERSRQIVLLRYAQEKTQQEIASLLGISQVQVSRLEKKILLALREKLI